MRKIRYLSLFSGIEAATVAWEGFGWECAAVAEVEPFPCGLLSHHYPNTPNLGDVTKVTQQDIEALGHIDVVVFGSPCQDLSMAGTRKGLINEFGDITRSGLFFTAINIAHWSKARFWLWENVPGAFSSNKGRDFAVVVGLLAGLDDIPVPEKGWGNEGVALGRNGLVEWATLDAQWFGVAQRRRRVFAILDTGNWQDRPPILVESESLRGNTAPRREAEKDVAPTIRAGAPNGSASHGARSGDSRDELIVPCTARMVAFGEYDLDGTAPTLKQRDYKDATDLVAFHPTQDPISSTDNTTHCVGTGSGNGCAQAGETGKGDAAPCVATTVAVRRLTPVECERLQGFPDGYTDIPWRNKQNAPDGPRYKALGNSMAVPVMRWIGRNIDMAVNFY